MLSCDLVKGPSRLRGGSCHESPEPSFCPVFFLPCNTGAGRGRKSTRPIHLSFHINTVYSYFFTAWLGRKIEPSCKGSFGVVGLNSPPTWRRPRSQGGLDDDDLRLCASFPFLVALVPPVEPRSLLCTGAVVADRVDDVPLKFALYACR